MAAAVLLVFGVLAGVVVAAEEAHGVAHATAPDTFWGRVSSQLHLAPKIILAQAIGFLVMFWILWQLVFRRVGGLLDKRRDNIVARMEEIERNQEQAAHLRHEIEERLAGIEREAQERLIRASREAEERGARILADALHSAEAEIATARDTIERERDAAILSIRAEAADLVIQATTLILGEALDEARQRRIVEEMIQRLSADAQG